MSVNVRAPLGNPKINDTAPAFYQGTGQWKKKTQADITLKQDPLGNSVEARSDVREEKD